MTVLMRVRYVWAPISSDEGGYLAVGRAWSRGARLYDTVWIDRQQGLLLLFRGLHAIRLGSPTGVRILAIAAGILAALAIASIGASLVGERARLYCGIAAAVLLGIGQIEGFEANAELLSGAIGASGLALVLAHRTSPGRWPLYAAGLVSGYALMTKQSAFDTAVTAGTVLIWHVSGPPTRQRIARLAVYALGIATTLGLAMLHGAITGWHRWWFAFAGYRLTYRSVLSHADWSSLRATFDLVTPILLPALVLAVCLVAGSRRCVRRLTWVVLSVWFGLAVVSFLIGGLFYRHYWMILIFPLATMVGVAVSLATTRTRRLVGLACALAVPLIMSARLMVVPDRQLGTRLGDSRWTVDIDVGRWVDQRASPGDQVLAICNASGLYGNITSDPPFPYLWAFHIQDIPGVQARLAATLAAPNRPRFVAVYNRLPWCDPSGRTASNLFAHYRQVATISFVRLFERLAP